MGGRLIFLTAGYDKLTGDWFLSQGHRWSGGFSNRYKMTMERKYPIGIQTFSRIRKEGYLYVDKTDLVWQLAHYATFVFLSRPRRFGKSLLTSTLESYFRGERELFEGLKIMELEEDWERYPVLRLDLSSAKHMPPALIRQELENILAPYEKIYG